MFATRSCPNYRYQHLHQASEENNPIAESRPFKNRLHFSHTPFIWEHLLGHSTSRPSRSQKVFILLSGRFYHRKVGAKLKLIINPATAWRGVCRRFIAIVRFSIALNIFSHLATPATLPLLWRLAIPAKVFHAQDLLKYSAQAMQIWAGHYNERDTPIQSTPSTSFRFRFRRFWGWSQHGRSFYFIRSRHEWRAKRMHLIYQQLNGWNNDFIRGNICYCKSMEI